MAVRGTRVELRPCRRCGRTDPERMLGLMTLWFGALADLPPQGGYFYLCPSCYAERIEPELGGIHERLARMHPAPPAPPDASG